MAKTANNSFGSDKSGIVIWKHNTMGHMDNSVEEAIARLVKKQQEGLVNAESLLSFASESAALDKPKKGFLKRFLGFGKKNASESNVGDPPPAGLVIKDKDSSFESRGSSTEEIRHGRSEFRVFRDGKGAAVVARSDGRNFKDLAKKAREAGYSDLARQVETAEPRQQRNARNGRVAQPTPSEIIDRVRARNQERLGRSASGGSSEVPLYGEIPIRSAEDLKAHRAELAKNRSRLVALKQKEELQASAKKAADDEVERPARREGMEPLESLERAAMVANWLQSGNITGNPVLYSDASPEGPAGTSAPKLLSPADDSPVPDLLEQEDRVLFSQKQTEEGLFVAPGKGLRALNFEGGSPGNAETAGGPASQRPEKGLDVGGRASFNVCAEGGCAISEGPETSSGAKGGPGLTRSPLSKLVASRKTQEQRFLGGSGGMVRSTSDRPLGENAEPLKGVLIRATSEIGGLVPSRPTTDLGGASLEAEPGSAKGRLSDGPRASLRVDRGSPLGATPAPWGGVVSDGGSGRAKTPELLLGREESPPRGVLVPPVKGLGFDGKRASPSELPWSPLELASPLQSPRPLPGPVDDVGPRSYMRQTSSKSEPRQDRGGGIDEERYDPAQWHKYLQTRSAQVLPNLACDAPPEPLLGVRPPQATGEVSKRKEALPLPLPPDLHPLPLSSGPPNWPYKTIDPSPYDFDASGGATPRSSASCLSEPHSPSSPLRDLLLSPHGGHTVEPWHVPPAYSG